MWELGVQCYMLYSIDLLICSQANHIHETAVLWFWHEATSLANCTVAAPYNYDIGAGSMLDWYDICSRKGNIYPVIVY